ncbi:major capsid protein [Trichophyton mentagrophytes]|nr:major capsid protein [Trichophyton mentagrophytes]
MALYVSPIVSGEVIRSRGGSTSEFTPGYVKPKHEVNPQMTLRRLPDEDPQNLADPAYRRRRIIMQNMRDEELAIAQVEEMQAVSAVLKGKYTMTGEAFDPVEVDMGRSEENNITQSGGTEWSKRDKSTYDPTDDIEAYALNASGVVNIIVFDPKGWALFRSFKAVKEKLDTRRGSNSELETAVKDLGKAVSYKGMYGDVAIVVYSGQYVENGVKKNFLPDNTMVLGNTQARGLRTYGCIQDADAQREGINASARYPKNWVTTGDPALRVRTTGVIMALRGHCFSVEESMTKDELIARLRSLGEQLNRDVSLTGTKEELALRVAELKEELDDTDETAGQDTPLSRENVLTGHENEVGSAQPDTVILDTSELVTVVALVKLHTDALHATRDEPVAFNAITGGAVADFDNLFDAAIARADETIRGYMGTSATITSGEQSGAVIRGVFDDPENISYAGQGVRVEGSSPSLFVRTDEVRQLRRGDTLTIGGCMAIKGLEQAVENLSRISKTAVPGAAAMAINRVASSAISQSASQVARETKVRRKLVKERARLKRATVKNPQARIKVNRGDLPVIKLGNARVVLSRRRRRKKGQRSSLKGGGSVLVVGNRRIPGAFIQQLKNGRWHVMQRVAGKNRYPIDVVKIPMAVPLTTAFKQNIERIRPVLDALEKHDTGATFFDGRPAVFDEADFPAVAVYLTGAEYTGEELDSDTWQAELHIEVFLPAQVPDSELDAWMESRIYPVMSDIPALSDLITSMVASGYDYRRDDDAGLWSSADLTYVITYEM